MSRLAMALIAYLVLGALAFATLSDQRIRLLTLLILAMFAFKSWVRRKDVYTRMATANRSEWAAAAGGSFGPM
jgi:uncharacterized membrane protein YfcA